MDLLLGVVCVFTVVVLVGHLVWIGLAAFARLLFGGGSRSPGTPCPRCNRPVGAWSRDCSFCGLELNSKAAVAARELDVTRRHLRLLVQEGELDEATAGRVLDAVQSRRARLLGARSRPAETAEPVLTAERVEPLPPVVRLEQLLDGAADPRDLPGPRRQEALALARGLTAGDLVALGASALLAVARLFRLSGLASRSLAAYELLVERHPESALRTNAAREAREFALQAGQFDVARRILEAVEGPAAEPAQRAESVQQPDAPESVMAVERVTAAAPTVAPAASGESILDVIPVAPVPLPEPPLPAAPEARVTPAPAPRRPRRSLGDVLAAFMEERNILWGELVGGLLIVGCSIALVITLWQSLEDVPYFPFLLFAGITTALFGAGQYTLHHWKLESTSRGLLVIALLLAPLNLLVLADPTVGRGAGGLDLAVKGVALLIFAALAHVGARDLLPPGELPGPLDRRRLLTLAVAGTAGSALFVAPWLTGAGTVAFTLALGLPVACHALAVGLALGGPRGPVAEAQARGLLTFLGLAGFAVAVALGFLVSRAGDLAWGLRRLALPLAVSGVPALLAGARVVRALDAGGEGRAGLRTAGTAVGLAGLVVLLAGLVLAWPDPAVLLAVALADGAALSLLAFRREIPLAHAAALPCLALAYLLGFHAAAGGLDLAAGTVSGADLARLLATPESGLALVVLAAALAAAGEALERLRRHDDAVGYAAGGLAAGLGGLLMVTFAGAARPGIAAVAYAACGACALAADLRWRRASLPHAGLGLLVAASVWALAWGWADERAAWGLVLAAEAAVLAAGAAALPSAARLRRACHDLALATGALAAGVAALSPGFPVPGWHAGTAALLAAAALLLAWADDAPAFTWVGSVLGLAALLHSFTWHAPFGLERPLPAALLTHATLTLLAGWAATRRRGGRDLRRLFAEPFGGSAVVTSLSAVPLLLAPPAGASVTRAVYCVWLAALWLRQAWERRSPEWFAAFQGATSAAVLFAVTAWLEGRSWVAGDVAGLLTPRSLQAYGVGLGLLGLFWVIARAALRPWPAVVDRFGPVGWTLDRVVLAGLVVGQLALAVAGVTPGVVAELTPTGAAPALHAAPELAHAYGPGAWAVLGVLAVTLAAALGESGRATAVLGLLTLAVTVPVLLAGPHAADLATASALRWGLAAAFLACSALGWLRRPLSQLAGAAGVTFPDRSYSPAASRWLLLAVAGVVLTLTGATAAVGFAGLSPSGPLADSFFARVGALPAALVPLVLLVVGLAGTAVRERSPAYAFGAGLVAEATVTGGYALAVVTGGGVLGVAEGVRLLQLGGLTAAVWALGWMLARPRVFAWRDEAVAGFVPSPLAGPLMRLQIALALAANFAALGGAVAWRGDVLVDAGSWALEAGTPLGGAALALALTAFATWHLQRREPLAWEAPFFTGLMLPVWLACCVERTAPGRGYAVLLLAWPAYTLLWSLLPFAPGRRERLMPRVAFDAGQLPIAVNLANAFTALVALRAVGARGDFLTPAAAALLVGAAVALLAAARRGQGLAFEAGLAANLAVSLFVLHFREALGVGFPVYLVQANVAASAAAAIAWLGVRHRLPGWRPGGLLLAMQSSLGLAANTLLLLVPLTLLVSEPGAQPAAVWTAVGEAGGWAALLLAGAAAFLQRSSNAPRQRLNVLGLVGLSAGVLLACVAGRWDTGNWLSFHVLSAAWAMLGLAAVAAGSAAYALRIAGPSAAEAGSRGSEWYGGLFPPRAVRRWLEALGLAVVVLALRGGWEDPYRPYAPAALTLVASLLAAALAFWYRRARHVYASGLLLDLCGVLFWAAWGTGSPEGLLLTIALGLGVASAIWTVFGIILEGKWGMEGALADSAPVARRVPFGPVPFPHFAALGALGLLTTVVAWAVGGDLGLRRAAESGSLAWAAAVAVAAGLFVALWDRSAWFPLAGLYALGLTTVGLALHATTSGPDALGLAAGPAMSGFAALAGAVGFAGASGPRLWRLLRLPDGGKGLATAWYAPAQAVVGVGVLALSVWTCLAFPTLAERLAGPGSVALLTAAAVLAAQAVAGAWGVDLRRAALVLGVLAAAELGLAFPDPSGAAPWLHRTALLMAALAVTSPFYSAAVPRLVGRSPGWAEDARRLAPLLGLLSLTALVALLGQEFHAYDPDPAVRRTPLDRLAVVLVAAGVVAQMVTAVRWALVPGRDPFGLSERGRTLYVYGVEVLLLLLLVHLRLNIPHLFTGWAAQYWPLLVMLIAYLGVGLGEFCESRGLSVLAGPLQRTGIFLPLLPLLAFWLRQTGGGSDAVLGPGPFLGFLDDGGPRLDRYAWLWLLLGGLYAWLAASRRSFGFGLLAALAANAALWSLLAHGGIPFAAHPQFWLIPPALILLAAEHLNRDQLPREAGAALRYLGVCLIYVSSTADLFISGVGRSAVWPVVLAVLAVAGVLAGILLRVRAFLFLGVGFLFVDVFTMIWHAAVDRSNTWVWWASGIVLGVAILSLFAVFEKRRNDVLRLLDELRRWD